MRRVLGLVLLSALIAFFIIDDRRPSLEQVTQSITGGVEQFNAATEATKSGSARPPVQAPPTTLACSASDFRVENFRATVYDDCRRTPCPALKLTGKLKNNCKIAAGAQIKITAEDARGIVIDTTEGWPASIRNIAPGESYAFDLGPLMTYRPNMKNFQVQVISARTWR